MVMPIKRDWNHSPNSGPRSISISLGSKSVITEEMSMDASEPMIPAACATTLCAISKTPITIFHVFVTMRMAAADLNILEQRNQALELLISWFGQAALIASGAPEVTPIHPEVRTLSAQMPVRCV